MYICAVRNLFYISALLFGILMFSFEDETRGESAAVSQAVVVMEEKGAADAQHYIDALRSDLEVSKGLNTRRTVQPIDNTLHLRTLKMAKKVLRDIRLKEVNLQRKVMENVSEYQTINLSTLTCFAAQYVYALRKLLI